MPGLSKESDINPHLNIAGYHADDKVLSSSGTFTFA